MRQGSRKDVILDQKDGVLVAETLHLNSYFVCLHWTLTLGLQDWYQPVYQSIRKSGNCIPT